MSIWAHDEQRQLVRVIPQRHFEESTVRRLFQKNPKPQMEYLGNQQTLFNPNDQGLLGNPQRPHEPPRQGDGVAPPATLAAEGGNVNFQQKSISSSPFPFTQCGKNPSRDSATLKNHNKLMYSLA